MKGAAGLFSDDSHVVKVARSQPLPCERAASPGRGNLRKRGLVEEGKESWRLSNVVGSYQLLYDLQSRPQTALIQTFMM